MINDQLLITGCSGFIGKALAQQCLANKWKVRGTVRSDSMISSLPQNVESVVIPDIGSDTDWSQALTGIETIVHLSARIPHKGYDDFSEEDYYKTNTLGIERLARAAAHAGVRRLLFLSTIKVNGEGKKRPYRESDPAKPRGHYAVSKLAAELILREISNRTGLESVILRPPLVYGPGVKGNFLRLIRLVERRTPLPLGSVANQRSMIFIGNLVDAILVCLSSPNAFGKSYLLADDETVSTPELIREIAGLLGVKARLFPCPLVIIKTAAWLFGKSEKVDRMMGTLLADTSKIKRELGWRPAVSFRKGLEATMVWYRAAQIAL